MNNSCSPEQIQKINDFENIFFYNNANNNKIYAFKIYNRFAQSPSEIAIYELSYSQTTEDFTIINDDTADNTADDTINNINENIIDQSNVEEQITNMNFNQRWNINCIGGSTYNLYKCMDTSVTNNESTTDDASNEETESNDIVMPGIFNYISVLPFGDKKYDLQLNTYNVFLDDFRNSNDSKRKEEANKFDTDLPNHITSFLPQEIKEDTLV